jgi:alkyl hydroperoxide reductase subunit AhpC
VRQCDTADNINRIDHQDATNVDSKGIAFTIRSVFIIDPKKTIRLILSYPASTGRNTAEVLRVLDSLQTGDKHKITTPINWFVLAVRTAYETFTDFVRLSLQGPR